MREGGNDGVRVVGPPVGRNARECPYRRIRSIRTDLESG
jgi:hypothetical protein